MPFLGMGIGGYERHGSNERKHNVNQNDALPPDGGTFPVHLDTSYSPSNNLVDSTLIDGSDEENKKAKTEIKTDKHEHHEEPHEV